MGQRSRVLVVDDDRLVRMTLRLKLEGEGYAVDEASTAEEAVRRLSTFGYDLVVTDLDLAGESATEVVRHAKALDPHVRVIVLTAAAEDAEAREAMRAGANTVLLKPYRLAEVAREARDLIEARRPQADPSRQPPP